MKQFFLALTAAALLFSCKKDDNKEGVFKGTETTVHGGKAWSSVNLDRDGKPQQLTLTLDNNVLNSVPVGTSDPGHTMENNFLISLHDKALENTPFQFIMLNWNPDGHEPATIYDLPHFDMHFYMTPASDVMNYMDMTKIENAPGQDYIPANHVPGAPVPMMGKHWVDVTSPEFHGQTFTQTFIYGSYDGKVVFYEPMITLDFLKNTTNFERPIPQPAKFQTAGYYPTKMRVSKHDNVTDITLDGFVYRQAS
jgi:hypothetical protein